MRAQELGYDFVDVKHCHGYLLHEFLGAHTRPGPYGGSLREPHAHLERDRPRNPPRRPWTRNRRSRERLRLGAFRPDPDRSEGKTPGPGVPEDLSGALPYRYGFGVDPDDPTQPETSEAHRFLDLLRELGIRLVNVTGGSPYYNPHCQRPALYPPSDGYSPPEDPTAGVVRHLRITRELKARAPDLLLIGSALSYFQDYLPHVAQALVRGGWMDSVGIGRMVL